MTPDEYARARRVLMRRDPVLAPIIRRYKDRRLIEGPPADPFSALVRTIVGQQLSTKAAATIHRRLVALLPREAPPPEAIHAVAHDHWRLAGKSPEKDQYPRDLAAKAQSGELPLD